MRGWERAVEANCDEANVVVCASDSFGIRNQGASAEEQIASAEARAVREVRDRAVTVAVAAAQEVLARQMDEAKGARLIDESIATVGARLH